jgi:hypothetical protein
MECDLKRLILIIGQSLPFGNHANLVGLKNALNHTIEISLVPGLGLPKGKIPKTNRPLLVAWRTASLPDNVKTCTRSGVEDG